MHIDRSASTVSAALVALSSVTRESTPRLTARKSKRLTTNSVEHDDVHVVAVNDPFIEPHYAVSRKRQLICIICRIASFLELQAPC